MAEVEVAARQLEGKYSYFLGSLSDLKAAHVPDAVLLEVLNSGSSIRRVRRIKHRPSAENKVWKKMSEATEQDKKTAQAEAKAQKEAEKKAKAEEKAKKAADKKAAAEVMKEAKAAAAQAKKDAKAAEAKAKKEAKAAGSKPVSRQNRIDVNERIKLLVEGNPKRPGTAAYAAYDLYKDGMTVAEYIQAGGNMTQVNWDLGHRLIQLEAAAQPAEQAEYVAAGE